MERFTASGRWNGEQWAVTIDTPQNFASVRATGHSRTEAKDGVTDLLAIMLGHRNFNVVVSFEEEVRG